MMSAHALIVEPFETLAFMRAALVACLALALTNGVIGTLLVLRRMSLDGDVLGHAVMPGAAIGFLYAGPSPAWLSLGGLASGFAVAALARLITGERARHDAGLVAFYLVALSLGVVLVAWRGSNVDVMRVLFGTVLAIDWRALVQIAVVSSVIVLVVAALFRPLAVGAFDPAFLRAVGARAPYEAVFLALVVLALVASFQAFGTLLAVGPMLLPAAAARCWGLWQHRWRWRPASGWLHRLRDCCSPITVTCLPVRRLYWRRDCCLESRPPPPTPGDACRL